MLLLLLPFASLRAADAGLLDGGTALRRAQEAPSAAENSNELVRPACLSGYKDITNGQAYYWACAFHCDGGPNYATPDCKCACLTAEQIARLEAASSTTFASTQSQTTAGPTVAPAVGQGLIVTTGSPATTAPPALAVNGFPVGALRPTPNADGSEFNLPPGALAANASSETPEERENRTRVETIAAVGGAAVGGLCILTTLIAGCAGLRRRKQPNAEEAPAITLYKPREAAPEPNVEISAPPRASSSRGSSKSSTGSQQALVGVSSRGTSRSSSKNSSGPLREAGKATDLDALATAIGNASNYSGGRNSINSWAFTPGAAATPDQAGSRRSSYLMPQRRTGSKCSTGSTKPSRVQPEAGSERRVSQTSSLSLPVREAEVPSWRKPSK